MCSIKRNWNRILRLFLFSRMILTSIEWLLRNWNRDRFYWKKSCRILIERSRIRIIFGSKSCLILKLRLGRMSSLWSLRFWLCRRINNRSSIRERWLGFRIFGGSIWWKKGIKRLLYCKNSWVCRYRSVRILSLYRLILASSILSSWIRWKLWKIAISS